MMRNGIGLAMLAAVALAGCSREKAPEAAAQEGAAPAVQAGADPVIQVADDDPAMEAAKREGRSTLPEFYRHLDKPAPGESMFSVKYDLLPGPNAEFIWASVTGRAGTKLVGELGNAPQAPGYKLGQRVEIDPADIIDWQYSANGKMMGHYTTRVLIDRMPAAEAADYRKQLGWTS